MPLASRSLALFPFLRLLLLERRPSESTGQAGIQFILLIIQYCPLKSHLNGDTSSVGGRDDDELGGEGRRPPARNPPVDIINIASAPSLQSAP